MSAAREFTKGVPEPAARRPLPPFTQEHEDFRVAVRRFVESELRPHAPEWEEARWFPNEVFTRCAELGYLGLKFEERYGGQALVGQRRRRHWGGDPSTVCPRPAWSNPIRSPERFFSLEWK